MLPKPSQIIFNDPSPPKDDPSLVASNSNKSPPTRQERAAVQEAKTELIKEGAKEKKKLADLYKHTRQVIFKASSVFPFDFFPDEITIDVGKVNIIERIFFFSANIHSITIKSIKDVAIQTSLFFAALKVVPDGYPNNPLEIRFLKKADAIKARNIIQGLLVADRENVEPALIETDNLQRDLEEIGSINEVDDV